MGVQRFSACGSSFFLRVVKQSISPCRSKKLPWQKQQQIKHFANIFEADWGDF